MSAATDDVVGGAPLAVQRIRGDHHIGEIERLEQTGDQRDLVRLRTDLNLLTSLPENHPTTLVQRRQQVRQMPGGLLRAPQRLPVDRDHPPPVDHPGPQPRPHPDDLVQHRGVEAAEGASDRRFRRWPTLDPEPVQPIRRHVVNPFRRPQ